MQTLYLDNSSADIAEEIIDIIQQRMGIKINQKTLIPLIFESGSKELAEMALKNLKKRIGDF